MSDNKLISKSSYEDVVNVQQQSLYARLKMLFATDVIIRKVGGKKLKVKDSNELMYATDRNSLRDRFNRVRSTSYNAYSRDFALSYQAARLDLFRDYDCVGPDTIIPLPDGTYPTIAELTEKYKDKPKERFYVFSYDHQTDSIKLGKAYHPRKKEGGTRIGYKVTFDNGQHVIGSIKHPFLMRNGEYKMIYDLKVGDSVMPFYQKLFYPQKYYRFLYNFSKGWQAEHKIIAEQFDRLMTPNECVHHKNFDRKNNLPNNLQIMDKFEHKSFHAKLLGDRNGENNPFYGKTHSLEANKKRSKTLKEVFKNRDQTGENNPKYRDDLTIEVLKFKAIEHYKNNGKLTSWGLVNDIGCDYSILQNRLKSSNLNWKSFKNEICSTLNHKIVSIESIGPIDVYDVTVEKYENFATDSCFIHNTMDMDPILSSALDIYADECVSSETIIPLLDGTKRTIVELYNMGAANFWVYSSDDKGNFIPQMCERVAYNGKKKMVKITLDDDTEIKCTNNHIWITSNNNQTFTKNLKIGDSLKIIKKITESNFNGNEIDFLHIGDKYSRIITSIEELDIEYDSYDLVNVGNTTHLYAIECKDGSKLITHNCLTENEMGEILTIDSKNNNIKEVLHNLFYDILNVEFNLWSWIRNMPVKYDSIIPLLSGENIRIDELSKRIKSGEEIWVYSIQDKTKKTVPGKVMWCDKNYTSNKIIKVIFDDNSFIETSPEHPFLMRNGEEKRADELKENDSLMPFYRKLSPEKGGMNKYEMIYNPSSDEYDYTHRIVSRFCDVKTNETNRILHHKNFNKYDNSPKNLVPMEFFEHRNLHATHCIKTLHTAEVIEKRRKSLDKYLRSTERRQRLSKEMKGIKVKYFVDYNNSDLHKKHNETRSKLKKQMWSDPVKRENAINNMKLGWTTERREVASKKMKSLREKGILTNHKVKCIEIINDSADVYCMTVMGPNGEHDRHNFAICGKDSDGNITRNSGVFVKNCKYGDFYLKLHISPEYGVYLVEPMSAYNVERIENSDPLNKNYVKFQVRPVDTSQAEILESFQVAHFRLLSDSNFLPYGKCLSGYSSIWTTNGTKFIKDINIGDVVYSFDYKDKKTISSKILDKVLSGIKTTYEIKTAHRVIRATFEHPFMISDGTYKKVKDLTVNDYLVLPKISEFDGNIDFPKLIVNESPEFKFDKKLQILDENLLKSNFKNFVRFFGFMLGDGWLEKYSTSFSIGNRIDKSQKYVDFVKTLNIGFNISEEDTTSAYCRIHSLYLVKLLQQLGFKTGTENKSIPEWVWNLPIHLKQELLFGFADADGCDRDNNTYQIESINENLIRDLREIAMQCGLSTTKIWQTESDGWTGKPCKMTLFTYKITSRDFIKIENDNHIEKIRSITECEKEEVYDIQVDNNLHNFIVNGIVVHNSMIESGRRVWKQLSLLEDAMLIHRIMRAPEKRIFKIDIGNIPPNEVDNFMEKTISKLKKVPYVDERTGDYNLKFNLQNMVEDFYLPVRGSDSGASIDTLPGMEFTGIDDLEYVKNKMMAALKIPKAFLGFEEGISGKATLAAEDVRFARTIGRLQKMVISELNKIAQVHLYAQGYRDQSIVDFTIGLTNPSTIFEKEKMEIWASKLDNAKSMWEMSDGSGPFFARNFVFKKIFKMSDDDIQKNEQDIVEDCKQLWRMKQITEDGNDPAKPFKKINTSSGDKDSESGPGGLTGGTEGPEAGGSGLEGDTGGGEGPPEANPVKEVTIVEKQGESAPDYVRPSQAGIKKATDYPFGEDPLGDKENHRKSSVDRELTTRTRNEGPLALEMKHIIIKNLDSYLSTNKTEKKELMKESTGKSLLDERNILE